MGEALEVAREIHRELGEFIAEFGNEVEEMNEIEAQDDVVLQNDEASDDIEDHPYGDNHVPIGE